MPEITEANADELIKICCSLHIQAIRREGLNENGGLWQLWKRLSDTLTDMGLLEEGEPEEEPEEEPDDDGIPCWIEDRWDDERAGIY